MVYFLMDALASVKLDNKSLFKKKNTAIILKVFILMISVNKTTTTTTT